MCNPSMYIVFESSSETLQWFSIKMQFEVGKYFYIELIIDYIIYITTSVCVLICTKRRDGEKKLEKYRKKKYRINFRWKHFYKELLYVNVFILIVDRDAYYMYIVCVVHHHIGNVYIWVAEPSEYFHFFDKNNQFFFVCSLVLHIITT